MFLRDMVKNVQARMSNPKLLSKLELASLAHPVANEDKMNLTDVTFIIPLSVESDDREKNVTLVIDYLTHHFNTNIIIVESGETPLLSKAWKPFWGSYCQYYFLKNVTRNFYKTKLLNIGARVSKTPIIVSYDSDVLLSPETYVNARNSIITDKMDCVYPFNEGLKHVPTQYHALISDEYDISAVEDIAVQKTGMCPPGGCLFMNRNKFFANGAENENMISYGPEDAERAMRFKKLGLRFENQAGKLYHLDHKITNNSNFNNPFFKSNEAVFETIKNMNPQQLKTHIATWSWAKIK